VPAQQSVADGEDAPLREAAAERERTVDHLHLVAAPGSLFERLLRSLGRANSRARHIHGFVGHEDHHLLTHQIRFEGDELVDAVSEGSIRHETIFATELHDDPAHWQARGLTAPYRTVTCDYVLRPIGIDELRAPTCSRASGSSGLRREPLA